MSHVKHFHVVQIEAVLLSLHVAVGPSKIRRVDASVLFAKLGGATAPIYLLFTPAVLGATADNGDLLFQQQK